MFGSKANLMDHRKMEHLTNEKGTCTDSSKMCWWNQSDKEQNLENILKIWFNARFVGKPLSIKHK